MIMISAAVMAEKPVWISRLPFSDDAYWGVGCGADRRIAEYMARKDILLQLCTRVKAAVSIECTNEQEITEINEDLDVFLGDNKLRGAEVAEIYAGDDKVWILLKYCDECGKMLLNTALSRYEEKYKYDAAKILDATDNSTVLDLVKLERRLKELSLENYGAEDILIRFFDKKITLNIVNFLPYKTRLSASQQKGLEKLSDTLFEELIKLEYREIEITGHANPTGEENESAELTGLSRNRAETMAMFLKKSGFSISEVNWKGGKEPLGDPETSAGRGLNRRVEIIIYFK